MLSLRHLKYSHIISALPADDGTSELLWSDCDWSLALTLQPVMQPCGVQAHDDTNISQMPMFESSRA